MLDEGRKIIKEEEVCVGGGSRREKLPVGVLQTNKFRGIYINLTAYTALHFRDV